MKIEIDDNILMIFLLILGGFGVHMLFKRMSLQEQISILREIENGLRGKNSELPQKIREYAWGTFPDVEVLPKEMMN